MLRRDIDVLEWGVRVAGCRCVIANEVTMCKLGDRSEAWSKEQGNAEPIGICQGLSEERGYKPLLKVLLGHQTPIISTAFYLPTTPTMVMLNSKTYSLSSYMGSPCFTQMEKTKWKTYSSGLPYPSTKEVCSIWPHSCLKPD